MGNDKSLPWPRGPKVIAKLSKSQLAIKMCLTNRFKYIIPAVRRKRPNYYFHLIKMLYGSSAFMLMHKQKYLFYFKT